MEGEVSVAEGDTACWIRGMCLDQRPGAAPAIWLPVQLNFYFFLLTESIT